MDNKFFIIGIRHNPQLGDYLSKAVIAKAKVNKASITAKFEEYGSETSLKFTIHHGITGEHYQIGTNDCVYGGYSYHGYSNKNDAINALKAWTSKPGSSASRAKAGIEAFKAA